MDGYFLSREDWDTIVDLGLGAHKGEDVLKKIPTQTKSAFTRKYNAAEHPIAFHRAQDLGKAPKRIAGAGPGPDLEEAYDVRLRRLCAWSRMLTWCAGRRGAAGRGEDERCGCVGA